MPAAEDTVGASKAAERARDIAADCVALRRQIHAHPELGWCEFRTTSSVRRFLSEHGLADVVWGAALYRGAERLGVPEQAVHEAAREAARPHVPADELAAFGDGQTGLVATVRGAAPGPVQALRCDLDALPIAEAADDGHAPARGGFRSRVPDVMHACGHDGHTAIGAGVAAVLAGLAEELRGTVRVIFQPAEEGTRGGKALADAGWVDGVRSLIAFHLHADAGIGSGQMVGGVRGMLATDKLEARFHGQAAHFAQAPHEGRNALDAANAVALLSHAIPGRPGSRDAVNVGRLEGGVARNIVPEHARLLLEIRSDSEPGAAALRQRLEALTDGIGRALDVGTELERVGWSPACDSDQRLADLAVRVALDMGLDARVTAPFEASDDAAVLMRRVQRAGGDASYLLVGADGASVFHTPSFDFDEDSTAPAVELLTRLLLTNASLLADG